MVNGIPGYNYGYAAPEYYANPGYTNRNNFNQPYNSMAAFNQRLDAIYMDAAEMRAELRAFAVRPTNFDLEAAETRMRMNYFAQLPTAITAEAQDMRGLLQRNEPAPDVYPYQNFNYDLEGTKQLIAQKNPYGYYVDQGNNTQNIAGALQQLLGMLINALTQRY